ncbi:TAP42-like protein [Podospora didyma]|uniref:TAP42-like protein n=1 Tax=Podospora didyma TaxID=330526 RepID=A0AAE0NZD4_9PEZI|nr:TAP42-like protein [Podospora didyma]
MDDEPPRSLKSIFASAEEARLSLQNARDTTSSDFSDAVSSTVQQYEECLRLMSHLSLFSTNEGVEDISTSNLPYLLVNYHLSEMLQRLPSSSPQERANTLSVAREALERYLHLVDSYSLLPPAYKKLLERYAEAPTTFSTANPGADMAAKRDAKIQNFRAEKELRTKLEFLRTRPGYAAFNDDLGDDTNPSSGGGGLSPDEEAVRAVHLAHVDYTTHMAFQALEGMNRELDVLSKAPDPLMPSRTSVEEDEDARRRARQRDGEYSDRMDLRRLQSTLGNGGPILSVQGKPLQPFTLLNNRQELAKGVFRPGHNLPTMTIDEYLEEERARGGIIEGGGEASWARPEPDEDNYEKADAETLKARAWDEFVESNPKGSGNTLNRG